MKSVLRSRARTAARDSSSSDSFPAITGSPPARGGREVGGEGGGGVLCETFLFSPQGEEGGGELVEQYFFPSDTGAPAGAGMTEVCVKARGLLFAANFRHPRAGGD